MKESTAEAKSAEGVLAKDAEGARGRGGEGEISAIRQKTAQIGKFQYPNPSLRGGQPFFG